MLPRASASGREQQHGHAGDTTQHTTAADPDDCPVEAAKAANQPAARALTKSRR